MTTHAVYPLLLVMLVSFGMLVYIYRGYLLVLRAVGCLVTSRAVRDGAPSEPTVTILLTVHNEEQRIAGRLENLLELRYPAQKLEILVASDGSTDRTNAIVQGYAAQGPIRLVTFDRLGKSEAQNRAVALARGEIIAFTDADCLFAEEYLGEIVKPFADPGVGCVTGHVQFRTGESSVTKSQGYYWRYELELRSAESRLGILAVASGSAMAVRKAAFVRLPSDVGEDCMIPLDTALQNLKVIHVSEAHAIDSMAHDPHAELHARVRMTLRNWVGTWRRATLLNPFRHPGYAFALWSHKILRWLSPIFLILGAISSIPLMFDPVLRLLPVLVGAFFALGGLGWTAQKFNFRLPVAGAVFSFLLANLGFLIGLVKAVAGRSIVAYTKSERPGS